MGMASSKASALCYPTGMPARVPRWCWGLEGLLARQDRSNLLALHRNAQRLLEPLAVALTAADTAPDLAPRTFAGRIAAESIDQFLAGGPVRGPRELTSIAMRPMDDGERAEIFRNIEQAQRVKTRTLDPAQRVRSFDEIDPGLDDEQVRLESVRCLSCGCLPWHPGPARGAGCCDPCRCFFFCLRRSGRTK